MGQSTDGLLWFGLCWTEEDEKYYESGLPEVVTKFLKENVVAKLDEEAREAFDEDSDGDAFEELADKLLGEHGCSLVRHCMSDYTMFGIKLNGASARAWRGSPKSLDLAEMQKHNTAVSVERLRKACEAIGWPWKEPQWWLASHWS